MATIKWASPNSTESVMTTELNSVSNNAGAITSTAVSNDASGELYLMGDFELYVAAQGSARSSGANVELYILEEIDGSNYTYGSGSLKPPAQALAGVFQLDAATNARYTHLRGVSLPPADFHIVVWNNTGQALASSGNTLKMQRYNLQSG